MKFSLPAVGGCWLALTLRSFTQAGVMNFSFDCPPMIVINFSPVNKMTILWFVFTVFNEPWRGANLASWPRNIPSYNGSHHTQPGIFWYSLVSYFISRNGFRRHSLSQQSQTRLRIRREQEFHRKKERDNFKEEKLQKKFWTRGFISTDFTDAILSRNYSLNTVKMSSLARSLLVRVAWI